jgi:hypothetical protein
MHGNHAVAEQRQRLHHHPLLLPVVFERQQINRIEHDRDLDPVAHEGLPDVKRQPRIQVARFQIEPRDRLV